MDSAAPASHRARTPSRGGSSPSAGPRARPPTASPRPRCLRVPRPARGAQRLPRHSQAATGRKRSARDDSRRPSVPAHSPPSASACWSLRAARSRTRTISSLSSSSSPSSTPIGIALSASMARSTGRRHSGSRGSDAATTCASLRVLPGVLSTARATSLPRMSSSWPTLSDVGMRGGGERAPCRAATRLEPSHL